MQANSNIFNSTKLTCSSLLPFPDAQRGRQQAPPQVPLHCRASCRSALHLCLTHALLSCHLRSKQQQQQQQQTAQLRLVSNDSSVARSAL
jgi:hypothetical protein